jgi:proton glutamate symport protein
VPAIVVFCVIYGIAIQSSKQKDGLLGALEVVKKASVTIWGWVVKMAPFGVFALFADLAGTIRFELLGSLLLYLVLFFGVALVLTFWVIPAVLASLLPVRHRDWLDELRPALVIAVATSLPITAVPFIVQLAERLVKELGGREKDDDAVVTTTLAVGYPVAQLGNLFVLLFIAFAGFYFQSRLSGMDWVGLPVLTIFSTVGTPVSTVDAVAFLSDWLRLPAESQSLYVELMTITRYPQVLVSAMGIALVTILVPASYYGLVRVRAAKLASALAVTILLLGGLVVGGHFAGSRLVRHQSETLLTFTLPPDLVGSVRATVLQEFPSQPPNRLPVVERIRSTGRLKVGYAPQVIPFSYFNAAGELVGYDIAFMYALARALDVDLELAPFTDWSRLNEDLEAGHFDLAVGGIFLTTERLRKTTVSRSYRESPLALIARTETAGRLRDGKALREDETLRIAVFRSELMESLARTLFPRAQIVVISSYESLPDETAIDAALWTLDQARAWASAHPGFSAVVPSDFGTPFLMAYLMPPDSREFAVMVDQWLELQKSNGFQEAMQSYWLEGRPRTQPAPRWSVIRNVLHWVK